MANTKRQVPNLRFKGFTDDWEQRKLGEITKTHSFKQYISEAFDHGKYMVIQQGENPIAGYANGDPFENFKDVTLFGDHTLSLFKPQEKFFVASDGIKILSPSLKMDGMFYYYLLEKYRPQSEGYKRHFTIMKKSTALFPIEIDEQIKISNFLKELDSLIVLHQRKLDHLEEQKKGFLQKMFPKRGQTVPEIRFPGFTDAWEQRKLGEVAEKITKGTTPHDKRWFGPVNYVKTESIDSNNGNISVVANTSLEEHEGYLKRSQLEKDDVLFSIVGTLGRVGVVKKKDLPANTNQQICIIRPFKENSFFLLNALKTNRVKSFIKSDATIGAQPSLSLWQIEGLRIPFPILEEQQKIGKFFQQLDSLIALHQRKQNYLKLLKKSLLQQMFM